MRERERERERKREREREGERDERKIFRMLLILKLNRKSICLNLNLNISQIIMDLNFCRFFEISADVKTTTFSVRHLFNGLLGAITLDLTTFLPKSICLDSSFQDS